MDLQGSSAPEVDIRLEDYLDDKLQSTQDLEAANLDSLLATVETQRSALQSQLDDAARALEHARLSSSDRQSLLLSRIAEFQKLQQNIDVRRSIVAHSDAPDTAVQRLQKPLGQLHRVELARRYMSLLADLDSWRTEALSHLPGNPKSALEPYTKIKRMTASLAERQEQADGAAVHLISYVNRAAEYLWDQMKRTMVTELEVVLKVRKWPQIRPEDDMDDEWLHCFEKLVDLQVPEVLYGNSVMTLLPMDAMAKVFVQEFRFHFMSDRPTSNPEVLNTLCFPWFLELVDKWEVFLRANLSHMLVSKFAGTSMEGRLIYIDPVAAFITSMLPVLQDKVLAVAEVYKDTPANLSALMKQLLSFDEKIRLRFYYDGGDAERGWAGLAGPVLDRHFERWLVAEKEFALKRFEDIMTPRKARSINYEHGGLGRMKPTHGAVQIMEMLQTITNQYRCVKRLSYKINFLIEIQITLLDEFHDRMRAHLEVYISATSAVGRTLHGISKEDLEALEGTGAFEALCKVIGSADYIVKTLQDWSMDEFFIRMWEELQSKTKPSEDRPRTANSMLYNEVKDRMSATVSYDDEDGSLFDETIAAFSARIQRAQELLVSALVESHKVVFRPYLSKPQWTTISAHIEQDPNELPINAELAEPLKIMKRNLDYISRCLSTAAFHRVCREVLEKLQDMLWSEVLNRQHFTTLGAAQLARDLGAIVALVERYLPGAIGHFGAMQEGVLLLGLPVVAPEGSLSLKEASDRIFKDNTDAKAVLDELGIEILTPTTARGILQRRVENEE